MEASRTLLSSSPPLSRRTHLRNSLSSSVLMLHEPAATSVPVTSIARHFPASVLLQEQRDELRPLLNTIKDDKSYQATSDTRSMEIGTSVHEGKNSDLDHVVRQFERQLLHWPNLWNLGPQLQSPSMSLPAQSSMINTKQLMDVEPSDVINLAKKALFASKEAAFLADMSTDLDSSVSMSLGPTISSEFPVQDVKIVKSTRHIERQSKNRRMPKSKDSFDEPSIFNRADVRKKKSEGFDPDDPLRLFLCGPETRQLLTAKEESELVAQVQDLMKLEGVKSRFQSHFGREPTFVEWAQAAGLSCRVLRTQLHSGNSSRDRLITANLRMVVHVAKHYLGRGLGLQDLLQEGSMGLMRSVEKFKPNAGCRFASYAYWWIRQTIRKAIFRHSRTIRLPDNVYALLGKIKESKRLYVQEGNHDPTKEELARRTGITVDRLDKLLFMARTPLSMQQPIWADQDTTFQEITADTKIETPDVSVGKQLMRRHVRGLLNTLNPRERLIIRLRFGIEDGKQKSLSDIGNMFGLSKERVRQLESRALYKLKQFYGSHGLDAYKDLIV